MDSPLFTSRTVEMMLKKEKQEEEEGRGETSLTMAHGSVSSGTGGSSKQSGCVLRSHFTDGSSSFSLCFFFLCFFFPILCPLYFFVFLPFLFFFFCSLFFFLSSFLPFLCSPLFFFLFFFVSFFCSFLSSFFSVFHLSFFLLFFFSWSSPCIYKGQGRELP